MPFEDLKEKLLLGGIAPRHVRRYLRELEEHLADLTEAQRKTGLNDTDAAMMARAQLGEDDALAQAMIKQRDFRSVSARFPWLVFGLLPPLAVILSCVILLMILVGIGVASGAIVPDQKIPLPLPLPGWFAWTAGTLILAANCLVVPLLAFLLAWTAQRQRMKPVWPLLAMAIIVLLGLHADFHADAETINVTLVTMLPIKSPLGPGGFIHWPTFLLQALLVALPVTWLLWTGRKAGSRA